jgi:hypothetical protein
MNELILFAYAGVGLGMGVVLFAFNDILYQGFFTKTEPKVLNNYQYVIFTPLFCFLWPLRFVHFFNSAFCTRRKGTTDVLPL